MSQRRFLTMVFGPGLCTLPYLKTCPFSAQRLWHSVISFSKTFLPGTSPSLAQGSLLARNAALPASGLASSGASLGSNWIFTPYVVPTTTGCTRLALNIEDSFGPFVWCQHHLPLALSLAGARISLLKATPRLKLAFLFSFVLFSSYPFPFLFETII